MLNGRGMTLDPAATLAAIVAAHPSTARVFQRRGLDFCCHGEVPLREACAEQGLDAAAVLAEAEAAAERRDASEVDARGLSTAALVARIVDRHHGYLRAALPALVPLAAKVARVHGAHEPSLVPLAAAVEALGAMLGPHLDDEEQKLFPALLGREPDLEVARRELAAMHDDHRAVGAKLGELRALSGGFSAPEWGCASYRALMCGLEELEGDILRHVHLENHVLLPRFVPARAAA